MADNTVQNATDTIATDDVTTLNGAASSGVKVQRVKATYGDDGTARDVSSTFPLPVHQPDTTATGNITFGGGSVAVATSGSGDVSVQISGTWVATLVFQATTDGTNWFNVNAIVPVTGTPVTGTTFGGQWRISGGGYAQVRVWASSYTSGTVAVTLVASAASSMTTVADPLPAGTNLIGRFTRSTDGQRTAVSINYNATAPPTTDTLLTTLALNKGNTASTNQTSIPVTSGKIMRLTHVIVGVRATVATLPYGLLTLRINHTGAAVLGSPAFFQVAISGTAAVIGNTGVTAASIEDGFEMSGTMQLGLSYSGNLATNVVSASLLGYEYTA